MPVTFEAAEKQPTRSGRFRAASSRSRSSAASIPPRRSSPIATTSAPDSRQGSSLEWCSYGPTKTTGRGSDGGSAGRPVMPSSRVSLSTPAVAPEPQKITRSSGPAPTAQAIRARACSRSRVVRRPVVELSLWVFAYPGSTPVRIASSTKSSARPDAV
jgi:hypothetical protein